MVPDFESAVGALRTYRQHGHYGDGIHDLYAHTLGSAHLSPKAALHVVVALSHWIADINVRMDVVT